MKKLVFVFAAIVAVSFASCGNKTAKTAETPVEVVEVETVQEVAVDTVAVDTVTVAE